MKMTFNIKLNNDTIRPYSKLNFIKYKNLVTHTSNFKYCKIEPNQKLLCFIFNCSYTRLNYRQW